MASYPLIQQLRISQCNAATLIQYADQIHKQFHQVTT